MRPQSRKRSRINSLTTPGSGFFRCNGAVDGGLFTTSFQLNLPSPTCVSKCLWLLPAQAATTITLNMSHNYPIAVTECQNVTLVSWARANWEIPPVFPEKIVAFPWFAAKRHEFVGPSQGRMRIFQYLLGTKGTRKQVGNVVKHGKRVGKTLHFNGGSQQCFNIER